MLLPLLQFRPNLWNHPVGWFFCFCAFVKIFSGTSNQPLAKSICTSINIDLGKCTVSSFPDGETFVKIDENVRGEDVFLVQSTSPPTNHNLMEMFIMIDALRRARLDTRFAYVSSQSRTQSVSWRANWHSAQPIALRMKKSV